MTRLSKPSFYHDSGAPLWGDGEPTTTLEYTEVWTAMRHTRSVIIFAENGTMRQTRGRSAMFTPADLVMWLFGAWMDSGSEQVRRRRMWRFLTGMAVFAVIVWLVVWAIDRE